MTCFHDYGSGRNRYTRRRDADCVYPELSSAAARWIGPDGKDHGRDVPRCTILYIPSPPIRTRPVTPCIGPADERMLWIRHAFREIGCQVSGILDALFFEGLSHTRSP